ncbi:hypothetical protein ACW95P_04880 [Candidatus Mycoplasma pogonae]
MLNKLEAMGFALAAEGGFSPVEPVKEFSKTVGYWFLEIGTAIGAITLGLLFIYQIVKIAMAHNKGNAQDKSDHMRSAGIILVCIILFIIAVAVGFTFITKYAEDAVGSIKNG